jgi:ribonuclease D
MENNFNFETKISREQIYQLPLKLFEGTIHLVDSETNFDKIINRLNKELVLGFDTETRPTFRKGKTNQVALLQLSTNTDAYLFRLNRIGLPESLAKLLASKNIMKIGVALKDDLRTLRKLREFKPEGFIDLQQYVKDFGIEDNGLKKLVANILNFRISKGQQTSNWELEDLSPQQMEYAATDAWVCYEIFKKLNGSFHGNE